MKEIYIERILKMFKVDKENLSSKSEDKKIIRARKLIVLGLNCWCNCSTKEIAILLNFKESDVEKIKEEKEYKNDIRKGRDIFLDINKEFKMETCKYLADKGYAFFKYYYALHLAVVNLYENVEEEMVKYYIQAAMLGRNGAYAVLANYYKRNKKLSDLLYTLASSGYEVNKELVKEIYSGKSFGNEELIYTINDGEFSRSFLTDVHSNDKYIDYEDGVYDYKKGFSLYSQLGDFLTKEVKYPSHLNEISRYERCNIFMFPSYDLKNIKVSLNREKVGEKVFILDVEKFTLEECKDIKD